MVHIRVLLVVVSLMAALPPVTPRSLEEIAIGIIHESAPSAASGGGLETVQRYWSYNVTANASVSLNYTTHSTLVARSMADIKRAACSLLSRDVVAIVAYTSCSVTTALHSVLVPHNVPVLLAGNDCPGRLGQEASVAERLTGPVKDMVSVMVDIVRGERWTKVVLIYDQGHGVAVQHLLSALSFLTVSTLQLTAGHSSGGVLAENRDSLLHARHFLLWAGQDRLVTVLTEARLSLLDILGPDYQWLILDDGESLDMGSLAPLLMDGDNVAVVARQSEVEAVKDRAGWDALLYSLSCLLEPGNLTMAEFSDNEPRTHENGTDADIEQLFMLPNTTCLNPQYWKGGSNLTLQLQNYWSITDPNVNQTIFTINTLEFTKNGTQEFVSVGGWSRGHDLQLKHLFPRLHQGFNNRTFRITTIPDEPFVYKYANETYGGLLFEIVDELARHLNFSYEVVVPAEGTFGIEKEDGSFTGMMGQLQRKEVDFAVGTVTVNAARERVADFSAPFMTDPAVILVQQPSLTSQNIFICVGPFDKDVWFALIASVIVTGGCCWLVLWSSPASRAHSPVYSAALNLWQTFGALLQQGMVHVAPSPSWRVIVAFWWLAALVVVGTYNGNLIAFFTAPKVASNINSLDDLLKSGMSFGFLKETSTHQLFRDAKPGTVYHKLYSRIKDDESTYLYDSNVAGLTRVLTDPGYAYLAYKKVYDVMGGWNLTTAAGVDECHIVLSGRTLVKDMYAFPFVKDSTYVRRFSIEILRLMEAGLQIRWKSKWYPTVASVKCSASNSGQQQADDMSISLSETQGAFYLLGFGLVAGVSMLLVEYILQISKKYRLKSSNPTIVSSAQGILHSLFFQVQVQHGPANSNHIITSSKPMNNSGSESHSKGGPVTADSYYTYSSLEKQYGYYYKAYDSRDVKQWASYKQTVNQTADTPRGPSSGSDSEGTSHEWSNGHAGSGVTHLEHVAVFTIGNVLQQAPCRTVTGNQSRSGRKCSVRQASATKSKHLEAEGYSTKL